MKDVKASLVVVAILAPALAAADPIKVAVVPGVAVNIDAARVDALGQDLAEALSAELVVDAVGGLEVRRKLPPDGVPADCVTTPACAADVAKKTGAQQLLFVVMVDSGGAVQVDTTWVEPTTGKNVSRPAIDLTSTGDSDAKAKFASAATTLLPDAALRPKPKQGINIDTRMTEGTPRHLTPPAMATGAATVVGLGVGIAFGLQTRSKYNDCNTDVTCGVNDPRRDTIRTDGLIADAGFLVATGAAIATVVLYMTSAEAPHVMIAPSPEGGSVSLIGRF